MRQITLVDNSTVTYSNPVRQSLFKFRDCLDGGTGIPEGAAQEIFPGIESVGVNLSIAMPGHDIGSEEKAIEEVRSDVTKLEELIKSHDIVFLLMDTRESRWLPTLLSSYLSQDMHQRCPWV